MSGISLKDIIDVEFLQNVQDSFTEVTKLAAVTVDFRGEPITDYSNFTQHCLRFRESGPCRDMCCQSDAYGGIQSARSGKPHIFKCHAGLYDMAVPIIFEGQYLGSILAGQVRVREESGRFRSNNIPGEKEAFLILDSKERRRLYAETPEMTEEDLESAAKLLFILGNYVVKNGFAQYMQRELNEKNERLIEEMKVRMSLEKSLRDAELKVLKSQVNPHFLFNALNTISSLSMLEQAEKTTEVIFSLSDMLRYTIKNEIDHMVTLKQELSYVHRYLAIQKIRMGEKLQFDIKVDPALENLRMPFMILQPIVSNSIDHGIYDKDQGHIRIWSEEGEKAVYLMVEDDGVGMDKEQIHEILNGSYVATSEQRLSNGIGLINADKRLLHQFGGLYRLRIDSEPGHGTRVTITIPKVKS